MDFGDLDDVLDEGGYMPSFSRPAKNNTAKTLLKNSSNKSIESGISAAPKDPVNPRTNMLQIHKDTRKEVTTFQDFLKEQSKPEEKKEARRPTTAYDRSNDDLDINNLLKDDEPLVARRGMKPPINRNNDDGRSIASKKNDDNLPRAGTRWNSRDQKPPLDFPKDRQAGTVSFAQTEPSRKNISKVDETAASQRVVAAPVTVDTSELKKLLEDQLQAQRKLSEKMMQDEQTLHKSETDRLKKMQEEELKRRLQLKDLQISSLKDNYEMKIKSIYQNASDSRQLETASNELQEGIRAFRKAEEDFKLKSSELAEESRNKSSLLRSFEQISDGKERSIRQMLDKLEARQLSFKEDKGRQVDQLQRFRRRNQETEAKLSKKEQQLESKYQKKEKALALEFEEKERKLSEEQSRLRQQKMGFEEEKIQHQQEKSEFQLTNKHWQESRVRLMEELQLEKTKLITKELELNGYMHQWEARTCDLDLKEKQLEGQNRLISLQRKKWETERQFKRSSAGDSFQQTSFRGARSKLEEENGRSPLEKSLKQLKEEYLRSLGHI